MDKIFIQKNKLKKNKPTPNRGNKILEISPTLGVPTFPSYTRGKGKQCTTRVCGTRPSLAVGSYDLDFCSFCLSNETKKWNMVSLRFFISQLSQ